MPPRVLALAAVSALVGATLPLAACHDVEHAPPLKITPPDAGAAQPDAATTGGIVVDASASEGPESCGGQTIPALTDPPVLYFIIDRSGSMSDSIDASGTTKYVAAQRAVGKLLDAIGSRVRYGAALFPSKNSAGSCSNGQQIFPPTLGDPPSAVAPGTHGKILQTLLSRLAGLEPGGSTPTAATLAALRPTLQAFGTKTYVVLVTDGAPNCDTDVTCESDACIPDIEGATIDDLTCGSSFSCCDPRVVGGDAGVNCIDADATEASVKALFDAGIVTYVVGMPGSEAYAALLDRLAAAGGTARDGKTRYYAVSDGSALTDALFQIGTGVAIDCDLTLTTAPDNPDLVNVYFDNAVVSLDSANGWEWTSGAALALRGDSCETLKSGTIREVRVVYGCRTVVR
jgi:hypothetical protein